MANRASEYDSRSLHEVAEKSGLNQRFARYGGSEERASLSHCVTANVISASVEIKMVVKVVLNFFLFFFLG